MSDRRTFNAVPDSDGPDLETGLTVAGATGIEDELQDGGSVIIILVIIIMIIIIIIIVVVIIIIIILSLLPLLFYKINNLK